MEKYASYFYIALILSVALSCNKHETLENENFESDDKCGEVTGKFVWNWCSQFGAIEIMSNESMGENWAWGKKTYKNVVLATLDTALFKKVGWSKVIGSRDSIIYFNCTVERFDYGKVCKVLGGPSNTISITSFGTRPCPKGN
jgi:hypothetical protein